jgi:Immunity protein 22
MEKKMGETKTSHFWVGQLSEEMADDYFSEVWNEDDEDHKNTPLSAFAQDQGVMWYDHDFLEYGWGEVETLRELVDGYSYSEQWVEELVNRFEIAGLSKVNFFVFINQDEIEQPRSIQAQDFWIYYLGTIDYRI